MNTPNPGDEPAKSWDEWIGACGQTKPYRNVVSGIWDEMPQIWDEHPCSRGRNASNLGRNIKDLKGNATTYTRPLRILSLNGSASSGI